jgi:hypothetical protein
MVDCEIPENTVIFPTHVKISQHAYIAKCVNTLEQAKELEQCCYKLEILFSQQKISKS